jgi:aqualysin 1
VSALTPSSVSSGGKWTARVTIAVVSSTGAPVPNATVAGTWSNGGSTTCLTGTTGTCQVAKSGIKNNVGSVGWTVTGVTRSSSTYDAAGSIKQVTVRKP